MVEYTTIKLSFEFKEIKISIKKKLLDNWRSLYYILIVNNSMLYYLQILIIDLNVLKI